MSIHSRGPARAREGGARPPRAMGHARPLYRSSRDSFNRAPASLLYGRWDGVCEVKATARIAHVTVASDKVWGERSRSPVRQATALHAAGTEISGMGATVVLPFDTGSGSVGLGFRAETFAGVAQRGVQA